RDRMLVVAQAGSPGAGCELGREVRMMEAGTGAIPAAELVVDLQGRVALINERARAWFHLNQRDTGRPLQDLDVSYRPVELRSLIEQAYAERRQVSALNIERRTDDGEQQYLDLHVMPLLENDQGTLGASIAFTDVTHFRRLEEELEQSRRALETAYEELQSSKEELEPTNEELQSTVEELQPR